jgi:hypothetical protein
MSAYVPPHLRKKMAAQAAVTVRGVRWPSNAHGDPAANVKSKAAPSTYRNGNQSRKSKYMKMSRALSRRTLRLKPLKAVLKQRTRRLRASSAPPRF